MSIPSLAARGSISSGSCGTIDVVASIEVGSSATTATHALNCGTNERFASACIGNLPTNGVVGLSRECTCARRNHE